MKIVVCLKEVSGRESRYEVAAEENWINESNISFSHLSTLALVELGNLSAHEIKFTAGRIVEEAKDI